MTLRILAKEYCTCGHTTFYKMTLSTGKHMINIIKISAAAHENKQSEYAKTKAQISFAVTAADQRLYLLYMDRTIPHTEQYNRLSILLISLLIFPWIFATLATCHLKFRSA